jgi:hypothetical protein
MQHCRAVGNICKALNAQHPQRTTLSAQPTHHTILKLVENSVLTPQITVGAVTYRDLSPDTKKSTPVKLDHDIRRSFYNKLIMFDCPTCYGQPS